MRVLIIFHPRKDRVNGDGQMPIYVRFTVKSKRVNLSTGIFINPKHWNEPAQRVRDKAPGAYAINQRLDRLKTEIQDYYNQLRSNRDDFQSKQSKIIYCSCQTPKVFWKYLITILKVSLPNSIKGTLWKPINIINPQEKDWLHL